MRLGLLAALRGLLKEPIPLIMSNLDWASWRLKQDMVSLQLKSEQGLTEELLRQVFLSNAARMQENMRPKAAGKLEQTIEAIRNSAELLLTRIHEVDREQAEAITAVYQQILPDLYKIAASA